MFGALLINLSKDFNCLSQGLLPAKLVAYGVEISFVRLIYDYLTNKGLRTKVGNNYSSWRNIPLWVPQGSILASLLFIIYICDLFFLVKLLSLSNVCSFKRFFINTFRTPILLNISRLLPLSLVLFLLYS